MNGKSIALLVVSVLMGVGGWCVTLDSWGVAFTPQNLAGLLTGVGGVIVAWLNDSPIKPKV